MEPTELALRALRHHERSRAELDERLAKAGIAPDERTRALDQLAEAGLLSDERFGHERARTLAARSAGDELIRRDLARHGLDPELVDEALDALEPEAERAKEAFARRGGGASALRYLAGKGFSAESLEALDSRDRLH